MLRWMRVLDRQQRRKPIVDTLWKEYCGEVGPSGLFDSQWYLEQYPEASSSGLHPFDHYILEGWRRGWSPGPRFDADWYRSYYADLRECGAEPLLHYIRYGRAEGRATRHEDVRWLERFASLGENCEFGLAQRRLGVETLDLFRGAATRAKPLAAAIKDGLRQLRGPDAIEIRMPPWGRSPDHLRLWSPAYDLEFYPSEPIGETALETRKTAEGRRLSLLARKFMDDCEDGGKIFVYAAQQDDRSDALLLRDALRAHGPSTLLWVTEAPERAGAIDEVDDGLVYGFIDRWAPFDNVFDCSLACWATICRNAFDLWERRHPLGSSP